MEEINIRSEEVNEILGTPPRWMVNYGIILAIIFFAILFCWRRPMRGDRQVSTKQTRSFGMLRTESIRISNTTDMESATCRFWCNL